jgi:predicted O-methyltransferase YrrM
MGRRNVELSDQLEQYIFDNSSREPEVLSRLREKTASMPNARMQIGPEQGQFLALLVETIGARRALELGTFTGYSALWIALALPADGQLIACDVSQEWTSVGRPFWEEAGVASKIDLRLAPALTTLDALIAAGERDSFDFVFIDAIKEEYDAYYERCLTLIRPGGLLVFDNMFRGGRVADPDNHDGGTQATRDLNAKLHRDERVAISLLGMGDGVTVARKR